MSNELNIPEHLKQTSTFSDRSAEPNLAGSLLLLTKLRNLFDESGVFNPEALKGRPIKVLIIGASAKELGFMSNAAKLVGIPQQHIRIIGTNYNVSEIQKYKPAMSESNTVMLGHDIYTNAPINKTDDYSNTLQPGSFDIVLLNNVLGHYMNDDERKLKKYTTRQLKIIQNIIDYLKDGGIFSMESVTGAGYMGKGIAEDWRSRSTYIKEAFETELGLFDLGFEYNDINGNRDYRSLKEKYYLKNQKTYTYSIQEMKNDLELLKGIVTKEKLRVKELPQAKILHIIDKYNEIGSRYYYIASDMLKELEKILRRLMTEDKNSISSEVNNKYNDMLGRYNGHLHEHWIINLLSKIIDSNT